MPRITRDSAELSALATFVSSQADATRALGGDLARAVAPAQRGDVPYFGVIASLTTSIGTALKAVDEDLRHVAGQTKSYASRAMKLEILKTYNGKIGQSTFLAGFFMRDAMATLKATAAMHAKEAARLKFLIRNTQTSIVKSGDASPYIRAALRANREAAAAEHAAAAIGRGAKFVDGVGWVATGVSVAIHGHEAVQAWRAGDYGTVAYEGTSAGLDVTKQAAGLNWVVYGYAASTQVMLNTVNNSRGQWAGTFDTDTYTGAAATEVWLSPSSWAHSAWDSRGDIADNLTGFLP
jgi:hypothetical protein